MKDEGFILFGGLGLGFCIGLLVMLIISLGQEPNWQREAIEHGAAYYDSKTAEFKWKVEE